MCSDDVISRVYSGLTVSLNCSDRNTEPECLIVGSPVNEILLGIFVFGTLYELNVIEKQLVFESIIKYFTFSFVT